MADNPLYNPFYAPDSTGDNAGHVLDPRQLSDGRWQTSQDMASYGLPTTYDPQYGYVADDAAYQNYKQKGQQAFISEEKGGLSNLLASYGPALVGGIVGAGVLGAGAGAAEGAGAGLSSEGIGLAPELIEGTEIAPWAGDVTALGSDGAGLDAGAALGAGGGAGVVPGAVAGAAELGDGIATTGLDALEAGNFANSSSLDLAASDSGATTFPLNDTGAVSTADTVPNNLNESTWNQEEFDASDPWKMDASTGSTVTPPVSGLQKAFDKVTDNPLGVATLGLGAAGVLNARNATNKAAGQIANVGAPQAAVGNQLLQQFQSGTLSPADKAQIDTWEQTAIAQLRQFYAKAGISNSTQAMHAEQNVRAKAEAMRSQALLSTLQTGLNALNITDKNQLAAIQAQMSGDQQAVANASAFLNAYANLNRVQSGSQAAK